MAQPLQIKPQDRPIIAEVYRAFATAFDGNGNPTAYQQWFRSAGIVENHPVKMAKTLVIRCNFRPLLLMKEVQTIAMKHNLELYLEEVDANGNPKTGNDTHTLNDSYRAPGSYENR
jgi:hypothetical protein